MAFALVAFGSGAAVYVACVAVFSLHAAGASSTWWLTVAVVAVCHAASGFLAMTGNRAAAAATGTGYATEAFISLGITGIVLVAALLLVYRFPIDLTPGAAKLVLAASIVTAASVLALAYLHRSLRVGDRSRGGER
jgi:cobalamin synthase